MDVNVSKINPTKIPQKNSGGLHAPDWNRIPHAGMETVSKDQLIQQIKDAGIKFAQAKNDTEKQSILSKIDSLEAQYVSSASPDRKALYQDAIKVINQHKSTANQKQPKPILNFVDYWAQHDGIKTRQYDLTNQPEVLSSGGTVGAASKGYLGYDYMINAGGQQVMSTNGNLAGTAWSYTPTPAECKKVAEFTKIFETARDKEIENQKNGSKSLLSSADSEITEQNRFYLKA